MASAKVYYHLTKPGIVISNVMTALAGFFLASQIHINLAILMGLLGGIACVIASACVLNNIIDQPIDKKMKRTQKRALVTGELSRANAMRFCVVLGIIGFGLLSLLTNVLTTMLGVVAYVFYVAIYGWFKRRSRFGTLVGTVPGALPPVAGYTAVTGHIDSAAIVLFLILVCWQMPHFFAIAIFRSKDYKKAGIPVWPVVRGVRSTKYQMVSFALAFTVIAPLLTVFHYTGYVYAFVSLCLGVYWLNKAISGFVGHLDDEVWARQMFGASFIVLLGLAPLIAIGGMLP